MPDAPASASATHADVVNAIRALSMDAVQKANSGHPGMPMGMAEIAEVLWRNYLRHDPANPAWPDRDRFVLSNGHGSMLQYALLHLTGYDLPMEEIRKFRQLHSKTPGHPEVGYTPGVETTTGPLGQGLANAVGFALAEKLLAARFNRPGHSVVDHHTYVFLGDGCLMEGISHEACSLAGVLGLGKLVAFYDDNGISIDGHVEGWFRDDTPRRFEAYGWHVVAGVDGHDPAAIGAAIERARAETARPSLICCRTVIGKGSPNKAGTEGVHGAALGEKEVAATRESLGWKHPPFEIPEAVYRAWDARARGAELQADWDRRFAQYEGAHPLEAAEFRRRVAGELPADWASTVESALAAAIAKGESVATRKASQIAIEAFAKKLPEMLGGSADLTGSNLTNWSGSKPVTATEAGNYVYYGVREFGMAAIGNGVALHGGFIPYSGTFLTFSDYSRNALRMAAIMRARNIFVFTHDSIGLGEDGPTHQAVEHVASLRLIPHLDLWRPCDTVETVAAWAAVLERRDGPGALALSRQNVPFVPRSPEAVAAIRRGGYVIADAAGAKAAIIATGSEVSIALAAQKELAQAGVAVRVVSMPCTSVFDRQDAAWRDSVLPRGLPRVAIEAGVTDGWRKYVGLEGEVIGIDRFGESAPAGDVYKFLGVDVEHLVQAVLKLVTPGARARERQPGPNSLDPGPASRSDARDDAVAIRSARPGDAPAIAAVHRESWRTTYAGILPLDVIAAHAGRTGEATWRRRIVDQRDAAATWVAEREGRIVGFANCGDARHLMEGIDAEIYALYVLQAHQRRGAGRELVRACARHFVRQGQFGFYLWVLKANRARLFYETLGGVEMGEKTERLGRLHSFSQVAYGWHDLTALVGLPDGLVR